MATQTSDLTKPVVLEAEHVIALDDRRALEIQGAELILEEGKLSIIASMRLHWKIMLYCAAVFTVGMLFGYDTIANGGTLGMPSFLLYFGQMGSNGPYLSSVWASLWTSMSYVAQAFGGFLIGPVIDRFGRRYPTAACGLLTVGGTCVQFYSKSNGMLLAGKMINGFGIGGAFASGTTYASEIAPQRLKAQVQSALVLFMVAMQTIAMGILRAFVPDIRESSFRTVLAIQWAVGSAVFLSFLAIPESPIYHLNLGQVASARVSLERLYGSENSIDARLAYLVHTVESERSQLENQQGSIVECFQGINLKRTLTAAWIQIAVGLSGGSFLAQGGYFLISAGMPAIHAFDVTIGGFGLALVLIVISWFIMDRIGRRVLFVGGSAVNTAGMLIIGSCAYGSGTGPLWAIAILMNILISWQNVTMVSIGWVIVAELSTYRLRAKTQAISVAVQAISTWFFTFIVPYIYNVDAGNLGAKTGFVFMGTGAILTLVGYFIVPDTARMTVEEVDWMYSQKVSPRKFQQNAQQARECLEIGFNEKAEV